MRQIILAVVGVMALAAAFELGRDHVSLQAGGKAKQRRVLYYVDPMHPAYKSDKAGIAPDCGMALAPVYADDPAAPLPSSASTQASPGSVSIDAATRQLLGIQLASVEQGGVTRISRVAGRALPEDTRVF